MIYLVAIIVGIIVFALWVDMADGEGLPDGAALGIGAAMGIAAGLGIVQLGGAL